MQKFQDRYSSLRGDATCSHEAHSSNVPFPQRDSLSEVSCRTFIFCHSVFGSLLGNREILLSSDFAYLFNFLGPFHVLSILAGLCYSWLVTSALIFLKLQKQVKTDALALIRGLYPRFINFPARVTCHASLTGHLSKTFIQIKHLFTPYKLGDRETKLRKQFDNLMLELETPVWATSCAYYMHSGVMLGLAKKDLEI